MMSLDWNQKFTDPTLVFSTAILCYAAFTFLGRSSFAGPPPDSQPERPTDPMRAVWLHRLRGVFWLGVIPALISALALNSDPTQLGLSTTRWDIAGLACLGFVALFVPLIAWNAKKEQTWRHYPQLQLKSWSQRNFAENALSWIIYLVAYEFFFRGFFLYLSAAWIGSWPAILLMTLFYFSVHLPKNASECLGTIPMGILFGVLSIATGGIWAGVFGHAVIAISNDFFVVRYNPSLRWRASHGS